MLSNCLISSCFSNWAEAFGHCFIETCFSSLFLLWFLWWKRWRSIKYGLNQETRILHFPLRLYLHQLRWLSKNLRESLNLYAGPLRLSSHLWRRCWTRCLFQKSDPVMDTVLYHLLFLYPVSLIKLKSYLKTKASKCRIDIVWKFPKITEYNYTKSLPS